MGRRPTSSWGRWCAGSTALGLGRDDGARLVDAALQDKSWRAIATLDAATRMADALARAGGIERGPRVVSRDRGGAGRSAAEIPPAYWSVRGLEPRRMAGRAARRRPQTRKS